MGGSDDIRRSAVGVRGLDRSRWYVALERGIEDLLLLRNPDV